MRAPRTTGRTPRHKPPAALFESDPLEWLRRSFPGWTFDIERYWGREHLTCRRPNAFLLADGTPHTYSSGVIWRGRKSVIEAAQDCEAYERRIKRRETRYRNMGHEEPPFPLTEMVRP